MLAARVDPNGTYQTGQMYVQYFLPQNERGSVPLLLWHGGGMTGVVSGVIRGVEVKNPLGPCKSVLGRGCS